MLSTANQIEGIKFLKQFLYILGLCLCLLPSTQLQSYAHKTFTKDSKVALLLSVLGKKKYLVKGGVSNFRCSPTSLEVVFDCLLLTLFCKATKHRLTKDNNVALLLTLIVWKSNLLQMLCAILEVFLLFRRMCLLHQRAQL